MPKKNWLLVIFLIVLTAVYVIWFTDWFKPKTVRVFHSVRQMHFLRHAPSDQPEVMFGLARQLRLTEIKVVPLADFEKNSETLPLWHLVSDSNSVPLKFFAYGQHIRGMKSAVPSAQPGLLETNVTYRIFVTAGKVKGQHDFELGKDSDETNAAAP